MSQTIESTQLEAVVLGLTLRNFVRAILSHVGAKI